MRLTALFCFCLSLCCAAPSVYGGETEAPERFYFRNSFSLGAEWSNTSSHILLGVARDRRIGAFDLTLSHRLLSRSRFTWYTDAELQPLFFLQDPTAHYHDTLHYHHGHRRDFIYNSTAPTLKPCSAAAYSYTNPQRTFTATSLRTCGTRWSYAGGLSPIGQRLQFLPSHTLQPYLLVNPGFVASERDLPTPKTSSMNFTFDIGAGLALFKSAGRSISLDYRFHHLSNAYLGHDPGVDSQVLHVTYTFGR